MKFSSSSLCFCHCQHDAGGIMFSGCAWVCLCMAFSWMFVSTIFYKLLGEIYSFGTLGDKDELISFWDQDHSQGHEQTKYDQKGQTAPLVFYLGFCRATACNATHGIAVGILSVRLSVCPSDACIVTKLNNALRIFWYHMKRQSL